MNVLTRENLDTSR